MPAEVFQVSYPHVQQLEDPGVVESKNALEDENMGRVDGGAVVQALVLGERVHGDLGPLAVVRGSAM